MYNINIKLNIEDFNKFNFDSNILKAVTSKGYTKPTIIQSKTIPVILAGHDIIGISQTGTGKTASFLLPIIQRLLPTSNISASPARHPIRALILTPTRELANQIFFNIKEYSLYTLLRSGVIFGGINIKSQLIMLNHGVEILVATPGRLIDHLRKKSINLNYVQILVIDEADRMLNMGFLMELEYILKVLPQSKQTIFFSATFSLNIQNLAFNYLKHPKIINISSNNSISNNITQIIYDIDEKDKIKFIYQLIKNRNFSKIIIFCNSKIRVSWLMRKLSYKGIYSSSIHGNLSQSLRTQILDKFKKGTINILISTDLASRGLDIEEISTVINFDLPYNPEDYIHRVGRTARAGSTGNALSFCTKNELKQLDEIRKLINHPLHLVRDYSFIKQKEFIYNSKYRVNDKYLKNKKNNFIYKINKNLNFNLNYFSINTCKLLQSNKTNVNFKKILSEKSRLATLLGGIG